MQELSALAKKDPEFYKYLQDHDRELLDFSKPEGADEGMEDGEEDDEEEDAPKNVLTPEVLKQWQSEILQYHSLSALRQLLVAFRSSANLNDEKEEENAQWTTESPERELPLTAFRGHQIE